jgi:hypothetical protein
MSDNETSDTATKTAGGRPVLGDPDVDLPEEEAAAAGEAATSPDAARCLSSAVLDAALTADVAARLRGSDAIALTVRVPSSAWVAPLKSAFVRLNNRLELVARDGSSRTQHKAESGNDEVSKYLLSGRSVVGIANSIAMLPRSLVAAADANVVARADARVVCDAIARFIGASLPLEQIEGLGSLDFHDIVSAFRAGSTTTEIVERLRLAARRLSSPRDDRLPRLTDAVEYGPARAWGSGSRQGFTTAPSGSCAANVRRWTPSRRRWPDGATSPATRSGGCSPRIRTRGRSRNHADRRDRYFAARRQRWPPANPPNGTAARSATAWWGRPRPAAKRPGAPAAGLREHPKGRLRRALTGRDNRCRTEARSAAPTNFQ